MSRFRTPPKKTDVDENALSAFSAGANSHGVAAFSEPTKSGERQTETFLLRLTPYQKNMLDFVYENTNTKSKQKLIESILLPVLEAMEKDLRQK